MIKELHIKAIFWLAVTTWAISLIVSGEDLSTALFKPSGLVLGVVIAATALFERHLWKWKALHPWFVSVPNLIGTYAGEISSTWQAESGIAKEVQIYLSIFQTLSGVTVRLYTAESASASLCASLLESDDGQWEIIYTYRNEPDLLIQDQSRIHYGGIRLRIESEHPVVLRGSYFTDRRTVGEIKLTRVSAKRSLSFDQAEKEAFESLPLP